MSEAATAFQTWEWTRAWWLHYGGTRRLWALAFVEDGVTVGLAALTIARGPLRTARFVGTGGSDYLDLLAAPGYATAVAGAFGDALREQRRRWDWVDLQQVRPGAVAEQIPGAQRWPGETCPYLPLPESWEAFTKALSKKLRGNIGYYERSLRKQYELTLRVATDDTLETDLSAFFELHQRRWHQRWMPGAFASRRAQAFHRDAARALLGAGRLRLHVLELDGEIQATLYCFQKGARCHYYLGGFEPTLARLSLGTVLTARAIRYALEEDRATEFDFLRGNEPYKYRWGAIDRPNARLSLTRPGIRPLLLAASGRLALAAEQQAKDWMHHRGVRGNA